jgi:hypothetical protein
MADPDATPGAERPPAKPEQQNVGSAYTQPDGTLEMSLRTETDDGTNGEAFLIIPPDDPRYPSMVAHLGDLQPGQGRAIPPFPPPSLPRLQPLAAATCLQPRVRYRAALPPEDFRP